MQQTATNGVIFCTSVVLTLIPANRRTAFDFELNDVQGIPDGMAIDTEGKLWVACFGGGQVKCKTNHYATQTFYTIALRNLDIESLLYWCSKDDTRFVIFFVCCLASASLLTVWTEKRIDKVASQKQKLSYWMCKI